MTPVESSKDIVTRRNTLRSRRRLGVTWPLVLMFVLPFVWTSGWTYSAYGLGHLECQSYLDKRGEDQTNHDAKNTAYIHAYLSGYLTAGNMMHGLVGENTNDISINIHAMVQWLDAWCLQHHPMSVAVALEFFWVEAARAQGTLQHTAPTDSDR